MEASLKKKKKKVVVLWGKKEGTKEKGRTLRHEKTKREGFKTANCREGKT